MKLDNHQKTLLYDFMTRFYDICETTDVDSWTMDEFYEEFSGVFHEKMITLMKNIKENECEKY